MSDKVDMTKQARDFEIFNSVRLHLLENGMPTKNNNKIKLVEFESRGDLIEAEVGKVHPLLEGEVVCILESSDKKGLFYVCTPFRGVIRNIPYLATPKRIEHFD